MFSKNTRKQGENMKCDYCGRGIRPEEEREQETVTEVERKYAGETVGRVELRKKYVEEPEMPEKIKKDLEDAIRLTQEARRLRRQANILSLIALGLSVVSLVIRIMKCIGRW